MPQFSEIIAVFCILKLKPINDIHNYNMLNNVTAMKSSIFVHHVLFYLKNPNSENDQQKLLEGLQLLTQIECIQLFHIGTPANTNRSVIDRNYTYSWLCFFESAEQEEIYQKHPLHDEFRNNYANLWEKVVIYDSITAL
jgi:hypothetical protein